MTNADLTGAMVLGTDFGDTTDFTSTQLYSTASYQTQDLQGIGLRGQRLDGWDFRGQNLALADLSRTDMTGADLRGTNLRNACLDAATLSATMFDSASIYSQWTIFPADFDAVSQGLTLVVSPPGELDGNDGLTAADVDVLALRLREASQAAWLPDEMFDLNGDTLVERQDLEFWVHSVQQTWFGDANLDGEFNSGDLTTIYAAGQYEDDLAFNSGWSTGDWNADGEFNSSDLIVALADGGYEQGPRLAVATVPEPSSLMLLGLGIVCIWLPRQGMSPIVRQV